MRLDIYEVTLQMIEEVAPSARQLDRCDPDLARQLRRAAASVALNTAEAAYSQGKIAGARFYSAMASANEVVACLDVARRLDTSRRSITSCEISSIASSQRCAS